MIHNNDEIQYFKLIDNTSKHILTGLDNTRIHIAKLLLKTGDAGTAEMVLEYLQDVEDAVKKVVKEHKEL